jgi:E3 ubiquitin-protein ligase MYCBP2
MNEPIIIYFNKIQIGVVPVDGTVSIIDELQNSDGVWVRLSQESLLKCSNSHSNEGWCLQYNQHLEKTLLVPVAEPKPAPRSVSDDPLLGSESIINHSNLPVFQPEPTIRSSGKLSHGSGGNAKRKSFQRGPGMFTIVKSGASGHNVRSHPSMSAAPIGMLSLGDTFLVSQVKESNGEFWVQLDQVIFFPFCHKEL